MEKKSSLCFEAQVDSNNQGPHHYLKQAQTKLIQLKNEVDSHMKTLLVDVDNTQKSGDIGTADASILETLKQMASSFLEATAGSLPHKEYLYFLHN